ncbi:hypothetical protein D3C71_1108570 [compost metagenome]
MPFGRESVHSIILNWTPDFYFDRNNDQKDEEMVEIRKQMLRWCSENIGKNGIDWSHNVFATGLVIDFSNRPDAMIFRLTWS